MTNNTFALFHQAETFSLHLLVHTPQTRTDTLPVLLVLLSSSSSSSFCTLRIMCPFNLFDLQASTTQVSVRAGEKGDVPEEGDGDEAEGDEPRRLRVEPVHEGQGHAVRPGTEHQEQRVQEPHWINKGRGEISPLTA